MKGLYRIEIAIVLSVVAAFGILGNFDFAAELERESEEKEARPARVIADQRDYMPCQKLQSGRWLRTEIMHRGDMERLRVECHYGHATSARYVQ